MAHSTRRTQYKSTRPITVTEKACARCKVVKLAAEFRPNHRTRSGLDTYCRPCNADKGREWRAANPERKKQLERQRRPRTTLERRKVGLWVNFRMTWDEYETRLMEQGGACAVCGTRDPATKSGTFHVDHDHSCCPSARTCGNCVRGLLCSPCNRGIGNFMDDPKRLLAAARYLTQ